jgi:hypothetical protein
MISGDLLGLLHGCCTKLIANATNARIASDIATTNTNPLMLARPYCAAGKGV